MNLLEVSGLANLSLRAVARKAGVSAAASDHHLRGKNALQPGS